MIRYARESRPKGERGMRGRRGGGRGGYGPMRRGGGFGGGRFDPMGYGGYDEGFGEWVGNFAVFNERRGNFTMISVHYIYSIVLG